MKIINSEGFNSVIEENERVLIDFFAEWCGPCKMITPILEEIDKEQSGLTVCKVNVDDSPELAVAFKVQYIPTLVYIKNKEAIGTLTGLKTKAEILELISK